MIYGEGVQVKYDVIMTGRADELFLCATTPAQKEVASDKLMEFRDEVRSMKLSQLQEYYELYRDYQPHKTKKLR